MQGDDGCLPHVHSRQSCQEARQTGQQGQAARDIVVIVENPVKKARQTRKGQTAGDMVILVNNPVKKSDKQDNKDKLLEI